MGTDGYYSALFCTIIECLIQYGVSEALHGVKLRL